jgi:toxin-antitoxin system PIN domain toxin
MAPDVNVLVAAFRADHPCHTNARAWLVETVAKLPDGDELHLLPMVTAGFLHIVTHPKIFAEPTPVEPAHEFLDALFKHGAQRPDVGAEWTALARLCRDLALAGNQIPDAWIAAAITTYGYHLVTFDKDFRKLLRPSEFTQLRA